MVSDNEMCDILSCVITINYQCDYTINQQSLNVTINYIKY